MSLFLIFVVVILFVAAVMLFAVVVIVELSFTELTGLAGASSG